MRRRKEEAEIKITKRMPMTVAEETEKVSAKEIDVWRNDSKKPEEMTIRELRHDIKIKANQLAKECKMAGMPFFLSYYNDELPMGQRYKYAAMFPEEVNQPEKVKSEFGKFVEFLRVIIGFNKADYFPVISNEAGTDGNQKEE